MISTKTISHVAVKFSDSIGTRSVDTVAEHRKLLASRNSVWFGKIGQPLSQTNIDALNQQIEEGTPTYLLLIKASSKEVFLGTLSSITREASQIEPPLVPPYYGEYSILPHVATWFCLTKIDKASPLQVKAFRATTNRRTLPDVLQGNFPNLFLVSAEKDSA